MELIKREQVPTETGKRLYDKLVEIWPQGDFDYIEKYGITDSSDVGALTDCILDGVKPEFEEERTL